MGRKTRTPIVRCACIPILSAVSLAAAALSSTNVAIAPVTTSRSDANGVCTGYGKPEQGEFNESQSAECKMQNSRLWSFLSTFCTLHSEFCIPVPSVPQPGAPSWRPPRVRSPTAAVLMTASATAVIATADSFWMDGRKSQRSIARGRRLLRVDLR